MPPALLTKPKVEPPSPSVQIPLPGSHRAGATHPDMQQTGMQNP